MRSWIIALCCLLTWSSCVYTTGSGNIVSETRNTGAFNAVHIAGGFKVEIKSGSAENVQVEADDNLMRLIEVKVVDSELKVRLEPGNIRNAHLKLFITVPALRKLDVSAGASVEVKDALRSDGTITMKASSGSNIRTALDAPEIRADVSSGGGMVLSGRTRNLHAESSSGSSIAANALLSENCYVNVSSGGNAKVYASVSINANASSGGNIIYEGAAPTVKKSESSGGSVEAVNR